MDVSLEELVSWDVLDQFMGDMPNEPVQPEQPSSSSDALGLSRGLGSTPLPLSPALHGSQLPIMAPACGGSSSRYGLDMPAHQPAHANAATLAQSFMSEWQQGVPWQGALPGRVRVRVRVRARARARARARDRVGARARARALVLRCTSRLRLLLAHLTTCYLLTTRYLLLTCYADY